ncbi:hypothetical protein FT663_00262 [Candidozyma haemuli var. vulneris]|uniref:Bacteriophage T5 Orf172 DNA-binding domain-containing protein n=1 Tax=Candidozyma haemuli TaxID=45357 RepID=A0A2V1ARY9_9ASCO|nr:hypothetical protein CXQ85_003555 [[Candida] haemuloni]KAF3993592.1 hypothetical protein FT662_00512 [[Candida] haemuloni var. vulneris]KAF3995666.1 hypothetical protein FT663_00262 [[Candida] haemuloni var. vulneris]PVH19701.1 hypothetical protein CXQ85_003555 [[Candida] haemuloni]
MCTKQCSGIAKTGLQCKINVKKGDYCHYHIGQAKGLSGSAALPKTPTPKSSPKKKLPATPNRVVVTSAPSKSPFGSSPLKPVYKSPGRPAKPKDKKAGFIYLYTLASLMTKNGGDFFKTRNLEPRKKGEWVNFSPKKSEFMFVKVGMTTKTVQVRLSQWERQCNHKLICLHPGCEGHEQSLVEKLKRLTISKSHNDKYMYHTFNLSDKGFYAARNVWSAEQEIHALLKKRYGGGPVYCQGCVEKAQEDNKLRRVSHFFRRKEDLSSEDYKVHVEWFPIPKTELREVFKIIDNVCMRYTA